MPVEGGTSGRGRIPHPALASLFVAASCLSVVHRAPTDQTTSRETWSPSRSVFELEIDSVVATGDEVLVRGALREQYEVVRTVETAPIVVEEYYPYTVLRDFRWKLYFAGSVLRAPFKVLTLFLAPSRRTSFERWGPANAAYNATTTLGAFVPGILPEPPDQYPGLGFSETSATRRVRGAWRPTLREVVRKSVPVIEDHANLRLNGRDHVVDFGALGRFSVRIPRRAWVELPGEATVELAEQVVSARVTKPPILR